MIPCSEYPMAIGAFECTSFGASLGCALCLDHWTVVGDGPSHALPTYESRAQVMPHNSRVQALGVTQAYV